MAQQEDKPFNTGSLREITDLYESGEISYGKMVDLLNEIDLKNILIYLNKPNKWKQNR